MSLPRAQSRLHHRSGTLPAAAQRRSDFIPLSEYSDRPPPPTVRVTASSEAAGGSLPNGGGRYNRYSTDDYVTTEETNFDGINYYPEDGRRTGKTGYIKYNSIASNKY